MKEFFKVAKPVYYDGPINDYNQFMGFRLDINTDETEVILHVAARTYYRLFVDGEMLAHGPARTAYGHVRVDEILIPVTKNTKIAVEVTAYDNPSKYANDNTLESGLFIAEIVTRDGEVIAATGVDGKYSWKVKELTHRRSEVELMSHSRSIIEVYDLDEQVLRWTTEELSNYKEPVIVEEPIYLVRRAPYPTYDKFPVNRIVKLGDIKSNEKMETHLTLDEMVAEYKHPTWYARINKRITEEVKNDSESAFSGSFEETEEIQVNQGDSDSFFLQWDLNHYLVGFIHFEFEVESDGIIDILHCENLDETGKVHNEKMVVRLNVKKGRYDFTTFEVYALRHLKMICRGIGKLTIKKAEVIEYWYPDNNKGTFRCSDDDLNKLYEASRLTLKANTLDIFMDCPGRERGGWLCDSFWSARAAWMLFGDLEVEKDFLENFFLTNSKKYKNSFFPEVYPGCNGKDEQKLGITTWSFWLILQLCEYIERSGDRSFLQTIEKRVEEFVDGVSTYLGESGLLENVPNIFIDWSQANNEENTQPISVPTNALFAKMMIQIGELYKNEKWIMMGVGIRNQLSKIPTYFAPNYYSDSVEYVGSSDKPQLGVKNGFKSKKNISQAALFTNVWSGMLDAEKDKTMINNIVDTMGEAPVKPSSVNVPKAELFIGLCIRMDMLAQLGEYEALLREMKAIYYPQLSKGPGTLYEHVGMINTSLCHGFNGHVGVHLMRDFLGLGEPKLSSRKIRIAPHPCNLTWASGRVYCGNGFAYLSWEVDKRNRVFSMTLFVPEGWSTEIKIPDKFTGWTVTLNGEIFCDQS